ncbi:hypothetical protein Aduo_001498 [Ancylostoma duodenale]
MSIVSDSDATMGASGAADQPMIVDENTKPEPLEDWDLIGVRFSRISSIEMGHHEAGAKCHADHRVSRPRQPESFQDSMIEWDILWCGGCS